MMAGESDLEKMLVGLDPRLDGRRFSFECHGDTALQDLTDRRAIGAFREPEGLTLIVEGGSGPHFAMITLGIHSSLDAVGLTAAVSSALAEAGISANIVAAYFHDHVFVPEADAETALAVLQRLASRAARSGAEPRSDDREAP